MKRKRLLRARALEPVPGFASLLCHLLAVWPWASRLASLCHGFSSVKLCYGVARRISRCQYLESI